MNISCSDFYMLYSKCTSPYTILLPGSTLYLMSCPHLYLTSYKRVQDYYIRVSQLVKTQSGGLLTLVKRAENIWPCKILYHSLQVVHFGLTLEYATKSSSPIVYCVGVWKNLAIYQHVLWIGAITNCKRGFGSFSSIL